MVKGVKEKIKRINSVGSNLQEQHEVPLMLEKEAQIL